MVSMIYLAGIYLLLWFIGLRGIWNNHRLGLLLWAFILCRALCSLLAAFRLLTLILLLSSGLLRTSLGFTSFFTRFLVGKGNLSHT